MDTPGKRLLSILEETLTKEDVFAFFNLLTTALQTSITSAKENLKELVDTGNEQNRKDMSTMLSQLGESAKSLDSLKEEFSQVISDARTEGDTTFAAARKRVIDGIDSLFNKLRLNERFTAILEEYTAKIQELEQKIQAIPDVQALVEEAVANIPEEEKETPEQLRDGLETLEGDERLDKSAIKGLESLESDIETLKKSPTGGIAARSSNSTRFYDLSAQTNGTLKVFTVPKSLAAIVLSSDFPSVLMEGRGFTINASRTQITLTIDNAPSSGSQLLYQYSSIFN